MLFSSLVFTFAAFPQSPCRPPEIVFNKTSDNIFNETQEMYLGDVMAETVEKQFRVIRDDAVAAYVRALGERLARHLPPTNIKFQFQVVDVPDVNAFAVAGGRIYVTRKLIAFVRNEDELAGIIGHELGHAIVRHHSADISKYFREILGVTSVGDRADVFEKYNLFLDRQNTKRVRVKRSHEGDQQLEADRIGLFAMTAAGYDPRAFTSAWERLTETKGRTGNALSDFFGTTRPEEKRLREMLRAIATMPAECLEKRTPTASADFEKWRSFVVTTTSFRKTERVKSLVAKKSLAPYLRGEIRHFQFSPDGRFIIAQDSSGINVLRREPFSYYFRIEAEDAKPASFSPDSKFISFQTYGLRVERWNVEEQKPALAREVYVRGDCLQSALSPDGRYLVCYSGRMSLEIFDVERDERVFIKEKFYLPSFLEYFAWTFALNETDEKEIRAMQMEFSPDGRYFLGGRVFRSNYRIGALSDGLIFYSSIFEDGRDAFLAYDLTQRGEVKLGGELKNIVASPFAFYTNDKIIGQHRRDPEKSGIFTFPQGERVEKFYMNADSYVKTNQSDYLLVRPTTTNPVGVYDLQNKKFIASNKTPALDGYGDFFVSEGRDGIIDLHRVDKAAKTMQEVGSLRLPRNNLGDVRTLSVSPELDWLAVSERARGAVWNLKTGEMHIYIRGFRGAHFDTDGLVYADFPYFEKEPRTIAVLNPPGKQASVTEPLRATNTRQQGKYLVRLKTPFDERLEKKARQNKEKAEKSGAAAGAEEKEKPSDSAFVFDGAPVGGFGFGGFGLEGNTLEVADVRTRKPLWSRTFAQESPRYHFDQTSETVTLYWRLTTKAAKAELKNKPALAEKLKTLGEKDGDYLVQVLDANTGRLVGETLIETGEGSFAIRRVTAAGDYLAVIDTENRVLIYSLARGQLLWRFFGDTVSFNAARQTVAVENADGQLALYDLQNGRKIDELEFPSSVTHAAFSRDGRRLFVLTANQIYYLFDADGFGKQ